MFLVEGYRPASSVDLRHVATDGHGVIGIIDIPADETVLFLVATRDAAAAEQAVLDRGVTPIRVVGVRWEGPGR